MRAQQFIKDHGLEKARELLKRLHELGCPDDMQITVINGMWHRTANGFTYPELKRLVESVDLVKTYGGIEQCRKDADWVVETKLPETDLYKELKQAIADYESIYGEGNDL
ncbi:hypothetical protein [Acinetobacter sp. NIPH 817]|uniref:hypothetical protein n=1 Tax=Acinetobacter sp. NIPH 817 TaxID=520708 RepID=UPI0002D0C7A9|nr:hypothetical protein [Acinetobacter sp. NIPH 817]ENV02426.1 hypothetical protein F968_02482 [Acinetobacter sp. NIPH 817]